MSRRNGTLGLALAAALLASGAYADDEADLMNAPEIDVSESAATGGWYLRGDLGYAGWMRGDRPDYVVSNPDGSVFSRESFDSGRFSSPINYGFGVGYQFSDTVRADVTTDFFSGTYRGGSSIATPCDGEGAGTTCGFTNRAEYDSASVMANGYYDLGTVAGFTPYLGVGLGATRVSWGDFNSRAACEGGACSGAEFDAARLSGETSWRFTYSLMAGASIDLSDRVKLDFGYRFSDTAGGPMFKSGSIGFGATSARGRDDGFQKHEFRAGIRVSLW